MSILRNNRSSNTSITAKVFKSNEAIADGYYPREYVAIKGCYLYPTANIQTDGDSTVIFKVSIASDAEGYLFGSATGLNIYMHNGNITWNFNTTLHTMAIPSGVHEIGFVKLQNGVFPIVDGEVPTGASGITDTIDPVKFMVGTLVSSGSATGSAITATSSSYAIQVREVIGYFLYSGEHYLMHWYASLNSSTTYMYETRSPLAVTDSRMLIGGSGTSSLGNAVQYGVQLFDLREITGSGYRDLVALVADDGGIDSAAGWSSVGTGEGQADEPSALSKNGDNRLFAFCLNGLSKPSGWTYAEHYPNTASHGYGYEAGELHTGRQPKWSIWNDCIKFGFYVHVDPNTNAKFLRFNFLKIIDVSGSAGSAPNYSTVNGKVWLDWFDGYNTAEGSTHPPRIQVDNNMLSCYIYNGAFSKCLAEDTFAGISTFNDNMRVFLFNDSVGGSINYCAGNMLPWNWTKAQLQRYGYTFSRMSLVLTQNPGVIEYINDYVEVPADSKGDKIISADTVDKAVFRSIGKTASLNLTNANKWNFFDVLMEATNHEIEMVAKMSLGTSDDETDCTRFIPPRKFTVKGYFDNDIISGSTDYRNIIELSAIDQTGNNPHIGVIGRNSGTEATGVYPLDINTKYVQSNNNTPIFSCLFTPITRTVYNQSRQRWEPVYTDTTDPTSGSYVKYRGLIEIYRKSTISADTEYQHYIRLVKSINGIEAFKNYCDFGSPNASSILSGWSYRDGLLNQCWGFTSVNIPNNQFVRLWCEGANDYFPRDTQDTPSDARSSAMPKLTRVFVLPRRMLWSDTGGEFDNNITMITHVLPDTTTKVYSALYGDSFSALTHQKYAVDELFFYDTQDYRNKYLTYVSTETFYEKTNGDSGGSIYAMFRAYTQLNGVYDFCPDILDEISPSLSDPKRYFNVELYYQSGDVDYAALASTDTYPREGTKVATFVVRNYSGGSSSTMTSNGFDLEINPNAAKSDSQYFHKWGGDVDNSPFFEFRIRNTSGSSAIQSGGLYFIRLVGPGNF